ncbi:MAG: UDP-N-acetylmuramoyl-tripeptide--D-alanyl-D-alanine ligase [Rikenellaceae bacterium]|nr:UDP-N-acetylmuramoyl-tripeptide--D-alanyl-D-alanine ligase [Rikenellaceae bacterium]
MIREYDILVNKLKDDNCILTTDSRTIARHKSDGRKVMFIALKGDNFDGNDFVMQALDDGADYVVTHNEWHDQSGDRRIFVVRDTLKALQGMALIWRRKVDPKVIAVTGSNGKTTTKELTAAVVSQKLRVWATKGNLNNHIGVPLTLLGMPSDCDVAIIEMGASHLGEIKSLCAIAEPDMGVITNIGNAHLEGFGGFEGVKKGKGELIDYLRKSGGTFFYLSEDKVLADMVASRINIRCVTYSVRGVKCENEPDGTLSVKLPDYHRHIKTRLTGSYNKYNILAAIAIGKRIGIETALAVTGIEAYTPDNNRSQLIVSGRGNRIIADSYNANPSSFDNALRSLSENDGDKVVIAGQMNELGDFSAAEHRRLAEMLLKSDIKRFYLIGTNFADIDTGGKGIFCPDTDTLRKELERNPVNDSVVLVKGSRGVGLEKIYDLL